MVSAIMFKFSSRLVFSPSVTWRSQDLPKMVTQRVPAAKMAFKRGSSAASLLGRRVEQKATTSA